jgi:uncharacterized NAD(P)/FAD-binding protein YdhS
MLAQNQFNIANFSKAGPDDVVVIGGGSTASTLLIRLAQEVEEKKTVKPFSIHCFDKKGFPNGGIAYGQCSPHHILNSVRTEMSPWRADAFHEYCLDTGIGGRKTDFNRRSDYLSFLDREVGHAVKTLEKAGIKLIQHRHDVSIRKEPGQADSFSICAEESGHQLLSGCPAKRIVITAGYGPNNNFESIRDRGIQGYAHSVYDLATQGPLSSHPALAKNPSPHIVFAGSGPALYDLINDLHGNNMMHARLTIFSGSSAYPLSVRDVFREENEINITPGDEFYSQTRKDDLQRVIFAEFKAAAQYGVSERRVALDILKNLRPALLNMDRSEAEEFQRSPFMTSLKHTATPIPQQSHARLMALKHNFIQARLEDDDISPNKAGNRITIKNGDITLDADLIVNGTGHGRHNAPIFEQLKKDGLARVNPVLGTLDTDKAGYRLTKSNIACIGPSTHVGCDGVESFAKPIEELVRDLLPRIGNRYAEEASKAYGASYA